MWQIFTICLVWSARLVDKPVLSSRWQRRHCACLTLKERSSRYAFPLSYTPYELFTGATVSTRAKETKAKGLPPPPSVRPLVRPTPSNKRMEKRHQGEPTTPQSTDANAEHWVRAISVVMVDVLSGLRHPRSLDRWLAPKALAQLGDYVAAHKREGGSMPSTVMSSHVVTLEPGHYEFAATVWDHERARAVSGHIVAFRGRWMVTEIEL